MHIKCIKKERTKFIYYCLTVGIGNWVDNYRLLCPVRDLFRYKISYIYGVWSQRIQDSGPAKHSTTSANNGWTHT